MRSSDNLRGSVFSSFSLVILSELKKYKMFSKIIITLGIYFYIQKSTSNQKITKNTLGR